MSCSSCHAGAGLEKDSSPLVGVTAIYPEYISRSDEMVTMEERINGCMVRSMNGEPFAEDDEDLDAMVAYLTYISEGIPVNADLEWRKINTMEDVPTPDVANGEELFQQSCIACHAQDGSGTGSNTGPALWGDGSFNDGAGLARMSNMAGYIQNNMPKGNEKSLSDQEAADLAAFVLSQDRPEFDKHDSDWPGGGRPSDAMTKERRDAVKDGTINWDEVLGNTKGISE
ncbi:c-type cytochrome [Planococcus maitriensis]|uniref:c-type cytochrome n=1 Tax=Planococcus maitriensis TaxID=221799 RepID=UPI001F0B81B3|nr:c-type cytochrome [Planococcus maitriensis]